MACCEQSIYNFNEAITTIALTEPVVEKHGPRPFVQVQYWDPVEEEFYVSDGWGSQVKNNGTEIIVNHGGVFSGKITLS